MRTRTLLIGERSEFAVWTEIRHSLLGPTLLCRPDWCSGGVCAAATVSVRPPVTLVTRKFSPVPSSEYILSFLLCRLHVMCPPQKLLKLNLRSRFKCKNNTYWSIREPIIATNFNFLRFPLNLETSISFHPVSEHGFVFRRMKCISFFGGYVYILRTFSCTKVI